MSASKTASTITLTSYKDAKGCEDSAAAKKIGSYTFSCAPLLFSVNKETKYSCNSPLNSSGSRSDFEKQSPLEINLVQIIDGTGLIASDDVEKEISKIEKLVAYDGDIHEPPVIKISWCDKDYIVRIKSHSVEQKSMLNGTCIKSAEISFHFVGDMSDETRAKKDKKSSPDLTHQRTVVEGDSWQQYAINYYKSVKYTSLLARYNNAQNLRWLECGAKVYIPPIDKLLEYDR